MIGILFDGVFIIFTRSIPVKQQMTGLQKMSVTRRIMIVNLAVNKNHFSKETPTNEL